jgi:hypothetical protein
MLTARTALLTRHGGPPPRQQQQQEGGEPPRLLPGGGLPRHPPTAGSWAGRTHRPRPTEAARPRLQHWPRYTAPLSEKKGVFSYFFPPTAE